MEHNDATAKGSGPGLSTRDLLDAEPGGEHRLTEVPREEEVRDEPVSDGRDDTADEPTPQLFADQEVDRFRQDWREIQIAFVDDPKRAVSEADELVAAVIQSLAATFAAHKSELESQWQQGEAATEDLRVALRQYRSFFNQLLSS
jgi:hypothetical protein